MCLWSLCLEQVCVSDAHSQYQSLSNMELIALLLQQEMDAERQRAESELQATLLEKREAELKKLKIQVRDLEDYIDKLLVRIMEQTPTLLQVRARPKWCVLHLQLTFCTRLQSSKPSQYCPVSSSVSTNTLDNMKLKYFKKLFNQCSFMSIAIILPLQYSLHKGYLWFKLIGKCSGNIPPKFNSHAWHVFMTSNILSTKQKKPGK